MLGLGMLAGHLAEKKVGRSFIKYIGFLQDAKVAWLCFSEEGTLDRGMKQLYILQNC